MDEHEIDRAIDAASQGMMAREPTRALGYAVMARVRENAAPAPRRFVWVAAAASVVLCVAIAAMLLSRAPQAIPSVPSAPPFTVARPPAHIEPPIVARSDDRPARRIISAAPAARRAVPATVLPADVSPIEPLEGAPIAVAAIDVPQLEPEAPTSIEALKIDELTIEPLAASND